MRVCWGWICNPTNAVRLHKWFTLAWGLITPPALIAIVVFREHESAEIMTLAWLTFVSHYANFVGHWSSLQAVRTEVKQDEILEGANQ